MKKLLLIIYILLSSCALSAQVSTSSLLSVLQSIEQSQTEYAIDIVSDGLEGLEPATTDIQGVDAVNAVRRVCKGLPVKVKVHRQRIYVQHERQSAVRQLKLGGRVQDIRAHRDLIGATVELMEADSSIIDQKEAYHKYLSEYGSWETSEFGFTVPARPAKYIFRISLEGYQTAYVDYTLERIGRREHERGLPPFYLTPQSKMMREVTITASKVKFYYKGDTIIYNADAFVLAEGSMLDALIRQLPDVELKRDGRIYHNGKFVNDLLLNGKEFFRHDRQLMLENLPAYTVKDIAIYDKQTADNEWLGIKDERTQRHVIDVRLKKEYMIGWLANIEAGGGTNDRYLARLFAMRHTDFSQFAVVANANNLDDDSRPGENGNWQRGQTNDLRRTERADVDLGISERNKRWEYHGNASVNHQRTEGETRTVQQNYLPTGDTYDYSFSSRRNEDLRLVTWHSFYRNTKNVRWHIDPNVNLHRFNHSSDLASATFRAPVSDVSRQLLDELYSPAASRLNLRDTLVNRILRDGVGNGHEWEGKLDLGSIIKIPRSNENLRLGFNFSYKERDEQLFDRQTVNTAASAAASAAGSRLHHFRDNHPDRNLYLGGMVGYNLPLGPGWRSLFTYYEFKHNRRNQRSSLYHLDRLGQQPSAIDELPSVSEYQQVMDAANSFNSLAIDNDHNLNINLGYKFNKASYGQIWTLLNGDIGVRQQRLDYQRGSIDTTLHRTAFVANIDNNAFLDLKGGHQFSITMGLHTKLPDLENRINLRDDTDPMNVRLGNPNLRMAVTPDIGAYFTYRTKQGHQRLQWNYHRTFNAVAMGYVYDTSTGARTYRPENVDGNWRFDAGYTFHRDFGTAKKQSLHVPFTVDYSQNVDLVGSATMPVASAAGSPQRSTVHRLTLALAPTFKADLAEHHFELACQPTWERLTGTRPDFTDFNAFTCRTSASAILKLPWKLDLSTDLTLYTRTGYADNALNTNDLVWNGRLSRPFFKGSLVMMLDGFDILGQLSNVTRTINAQGRTETFTDVLPRYVLLHAVWHLNKNPKKGK
ncbi:MAG: hypothetical protein K6G70_10565 [Bacteroidaceae bacterium]|nr:hypothetical protein [Bacteroidaceae bacterium]